MPRPRLPSRWNRLAACCGAIAVVWGVVLPWIGSRPHIAARIQREEAQGINPSAMFYTELEALKPLVRRVDRARETRPEAFWFMRQD